MTQFFISCKESRIENNRSFYGSFSLGPFSNGQSLTIANALRRTLLSELKGIAIVSIQIEGVLHEYSSLPGIKDSVLDILLNLKEIVFKKTLPTQRISKEKKSSKKASINIGMLPQIGYLRVRGPGVVRASDLKLPPFIQLVDPEQYIATLDEDGFLNMKLIISEGQNYIIQKPSKPSNNNPISFEQHSADLSASSKEKRNLLKEKIKSLSGFSSPNLKKTKDQSNNRKTYANFQNSNPLTLDAVFSPINKVNYIIESSEHKIVDSRFVYAEKIDELFNFLKPLKSSPWPLESSHDSVRKKENSLKEETSLKNSPLQSHLNEILNSGFDSSLALIGSSTESGHIKSIKQNVVLEIWTNGSLHPREALYQAIKYFINTFSRLYLVPNNIDTSFRAPLKKANDFASSSTSTITPLNSNLFSSNYTVLSSIPLKKSSSK